MPDVIIKTPNLDAIFEKWKQNAVRKDRKKMEKQFGTKGSVFSLDAISAAEYVKNPLKGAAVYFSIKKTIAPSKEKEEDLVMAPKVSRITFYSFREGDVNKDNWKGDENVPIVDTITAIPCETCNGKGYIEDKCNKCKGTGTISDSLTIFEGENQERQKNKYFDYPCGYCFGTGKFETPCNKCGGHKNLYKYEILPVPFKMVVMGIPILHSSFQTRYEKEIGKDLQQLLEQVEGIRFGNFKELSNKAEGALGYWNKDIKKKVSAAGKDYKSYEKDKNAKIVSQIYLFPMIRLQCATKKGRKFEIYSVGSEKNFMVYSDF